MVCTPKCDIQGVHEVMNPTTHDQTMWLVNVRTQLVSNLEEAQMWYKENVNEHWKKQLNFKVRNQVWLQWNISKTTRPSKKLNNQKQGPFLIVKQIDVIAS